MFGLVGAGLRAAHEQGGGIERQEIGIDRIGQPALLTHLAVKARGERAAAQDVIDDEGRDEIRIVACNAEPAEFSSVRTTLPPMARATSAVKVAISARVLLSDGLRSLTMQ